MAEQNGTPLSQVHSSRFALTRLTVAVLRHRTDNGEASFEMRTEANSVDSNRTQKITHPHCIQSIYIYLDFKDTDTTQ